MPVDQLAHLEGCVSFRLDESITHRVGLAAYQIITNPNTIANDPDLPIYSSVDALIRKLSKNHNAPPGTSRVLPVKDLDYSFQRRLRRHVSYRINSDILLVFDTPLVVAPMMVDPAVFDRTPSLPCLSEDIRKQLVSRFPNKLRVRQKSLLLGLPCVCRPTPTKTGLMRKSQAEAYAEARVRFLWERGGLIPPILFQATVDHLLRIAEIHHPLAGDPNRLDQFVHPSTHPHDLHPTYSYYRSFLSLPADPTWEQEADALTRRADSFSSFLSNYPRQITDRRLLRRRWPYILRVLSWWHPYLAWLQSGFPEPHTKYSDYKTSEARKVYASIRTRLHNILRTFVPSHHFTPSYRLVLHPGFHTSIPDPFTLDHRFPPIYNVQDHAQHDRLVAYFNDPNTISLNNQPLPPEYPNPVPIL